MKPFLVDVPVRVQVWNRPDCLKQQLEVLKQARPSVLFLTSDGGRNPEEMSKILESRQVMENIDWQCEVHKLYMEENRGLYSFAELSGKYIWNHVDRCVFLEDDQIPAITYFRFCAEMLEKYKDDPRVEMICGYNPLGIYEEADQVQDYFFTELGGAIWGVALWKRSIANSEFPLAYSDNPYICRCLLDNLNYYWVSRAKGYINGELMDGHVPGGEYYHCINSVLFHRLSIVPTKNMIQNIGVNGTHVSYELMSKKIKKLFFSPTYELNGSIRHPQYLIDDRRYSNLYEDAIGNKKKTLFEKISDALHKRYIHLKRGTYFKHYIIGRFKKKAKYHEK